MAKKIKLLESDIDKLCADFRTALEKSKMPDGKIKFEKNIETSDRKAKLWFTPMAYSKIYDLIDGFSSEVAWHGIARRLGGDEYIVDDILVYPQQVAAATVETDHKLYSDWLYSLEPEVFSSVRMQGHSHVNMGVSPSGVDETNMKAFLDQLDDDMFYIFLIWNKKREMTNIIYDMAENIRFDTKDITVGILGAEYDSAEFMKSAHDVITTRTYTAPVTQVGVKAKEPVVFETKKTESSKKDDLPELPVKSVSPKNSFEERMKDPFYSSDRWSGKYYDDDYDYGNFGGGYGSYWRNEYYRGK